MLITQYLSRILNLNKRVSPLFTMGLVALFVMYRCALQTAPSVIAQTLMQELNTTGVSMGHLSAAFWYAFVITQLFVGYWLDRYNPKSLIMSAIAVCSVGALGFAYAHNVYSAIIARVLMGIGGAFAGGGYFKIASLLVGPKHFSLVAGLLATSVMVGVILGQVPLLWLMQYAHWRSVFLLCTGFGCLLIASIALFCPWHWRQSSATPVSTRAIEWRDVVTILKNPQNWLLAVYHGLASAPLHAFSGVWGVDFLRQSCQINQAQAALLSTCVFVGFGLGSPFMGYLADRTSRKKWIMWLGGGLAFIALSAVLYVPQLPRLLKGCLLFILGFSSGVTMISITLGKNLNSSKVTATVATLLSSGGLIIPAVTEPFVGYLLDKIHVSTGIGMQYFTLLDYQKVLSVLPLYLISTWIILMLIRERHHSVVSE